MDFIDEKEKAILESEKYTLECSKNAELNRFRESLINGMGENMISELKAPPKPNKWFGFKYKLKKFKENLDFLLGIKKGDY